MCSAVLSTWQTLADPWLSSYSRTASSECPHWSSSTSHIPDRQSTCSQSTTRTLSHLRGSDTYLSQPARPCALHWRFSRRFKAGSWLGRKNGGLLICHDSHGKVGFFHPIFFLGRFRVRWSKVVKTCPWDHFCFSTCCFHLPHSMLFLWF